MHGFGQLKNNRMNQCPSVKLIADATFQKFTFGQFQGWMGPNYSVSSSCSFSNVCILNSANHIIRGETVSLSLVPLKQYLQCCCQIHSCFRNASNLSLLNIISWQKCSWLCKTIFSHYFSPTVILILGYLQDLKLCGGSEAPIIPNLVNMCVNCIFSQKVHLFSVRVLSQVASSVIEQGRDGLVLV